MATLKENINHWYYSQKIKEIRRKIQKIKYPPEDFEPERWKGLCVNCYAYALNINVSDPRKRIWIPGCIANETNKPFVWDNVTENVKKDLDFLGFKYREESDDHEIKDNEFRIVIYYRPTFHDLPLGFHIIRSGSRWSEKKSWKGEIRKLPELSTQSYIPPNYEIHNLFLESVLVISKE